MMYWYHPTTTAVVDDDNDFLKIFDDQLELPNCVLFNSPANAIETLLSEKQFNRIHDRTIETSKIAEEDTLTNQEQYAFRVNVRELYKEIYSPERFKDISVIIIDYHMGDISGIDLCERLSQHPAKKILLTGGADKEQIAIEAFNKGIIHRFVSKSDAKFPSQLRQSVNILKEMYFKEASIRLINHMSTSSTLLLKNPAYMNFIRSTQLKTNSSEYYLFDVSGSILFMNEIGEVFLLIVKSEKELTDYEEIARDYDESANLIQLIKSREKIPFFFSDEDYQQPISNWEKYLYTANPLPGINGHFYSLIPKPYFIDKDKIFTYTKFDNRVIV